jgi:hypothetical protein
MANCEQNILDLPFSPSLPADDDVVMFTTQDGTTVLRYWSVVKSAFELLGDLEATVDGDLLDSEGTVIGSGPVSSTNSMDLPSGWLGRRIRVFVNETILRPSQWTRTTNGFELVGRTWNNDGTGMEDKIVVQNY